ncbi:ADP-ribosylglycohydrolase family protein [Streptomyces sp. NPDC002838]|uniref:ADP-ribosylglycohydrolase family protein n=1 Tax=Streptomyces sp. NPDC002838 TaxID=3154436 RepID=UPI0033169675
MSPTDVTEVLQRRTNSALWAAWADSLGFVTELTDEAGMRRRLAGRALLEPLEWKRRVGGKFGAAVNLPAGTYSDDTQLRLAVGRAIRPSGFDAEAFAKVELPIWTSYALGGGRASKAAASHITGPSIPWFGNCFKGWTDAGGNGAAMRVQPHVWAAQDPGRVGPHLLDVISDSVITHGHPRALIGALFHAIAVGYALDRGNVPSVDEWINLVDELHQFPEVMRGHMELSMWRAAWERDSQASLDEAWKSTVIELAEMIPAADEFVAAAGPAVQCEDHVRLGQSYEVLIENLGLRAPATRGSGTATVIAAHAIAAAGVSDPLLILRMVIASLGTDTDTIATMAAALLGCVTVSGPPGAIADRDYIVAESHRLARISAGEYGETDHFTYPDLLHWEAPKTQAGAVGLVGGKPAVAGLGVCEDFSPAGSARSFSWSWAKLEFGQTILVKHRSELEELPQVQYPVAQPELREQVHDRLEKSAQEPSSVQQEIDFPMTSSALRENYSQRSDRRRPVGNQSLNVDAMLDWIRSQGHTDQAIGYAVRRIAEIGTTEQMIAFTATLQAEIRNKKISAPR